MIAHMTAKKQANCKMWIWKAAAVLLLCLIVGSALFALFAQFDASSVPEHVFVHCAENDYAYYEWDDEGARHKLSAVYQQDGYWEAVTGSDALDAFRNSTSEAGIPEPVRRRLGFSVELPEFIDSARLVLSNADDIPFVVFLDDDLLYTDFPGAPASLSTPPRGAGGIIEQYAPGTGRTISVTLPSEYAHKTLTVIEYLTPEQAQHWEPAYASIATSETDWVFGVIDYGPKGIMSGVIAAVLMILVAVFIRQLLGGQNPCLLLLPIAYTLIYMIATATYVRFYSTSVLDKISSVVFTVSYYCAGDLLLIFLAFKMKRPLRLALAAAAAIHFLIASSLLLQAFVSGDELRIGPKWPAMLAFATILFAVILMFSERKMNPYLKYSGWMFVAGCAGYGVLVMVYFFTDQGRYVDFSAPINTAACSLIFYPLNEILSVMMMAIIAVCSIIDYVAEQTESRIRLATVEQMNRLKTEFLGNVSHELKTPLTVMSSYAQLAEMSIENQPETQQLSHHMKLIQSEADRLALMVSQILDVTKIEENRFALHAAPCPLVRMIQLTLDTYYPVFTKNRNELIFAPPAEDMEVLCDQGRIIQVLVNLIGNASKHTHNGAITVKVWAEADFATVEVKDTGMGMDAQQVAHAFDRFYTSTNHEKPGAGQNTGTGLGLYICQHIIREHGGEITMQSELGKGTVVRFTLPLNGGSERAI